MLVKVAEVSRLFCRWNWLFLDYGMSLFKVIHFGYFAWNIHTFSMSFSGKRYPFKKISLLCVMTAKSKTCFLIYNSGPFHHTFLFVCFDLFFICYLWHSSFNDIVVGVNDLPCIAMDRRSFNVFANVQIFISHFFMVHVLQTCQDSITRHIASRC